MNGSLKADFEWFLEHQPELVTRYNGRYVVIKDRAVLGAYDTDIEAVTKTSAEHEVGTFIVQKVTPGSDAYTQSFHSRVVFAG